jgi:hypothetical protein
MGLPANSFYWSDFLRKADLLSKDIPDQFTFMRDQFWFIPDQFLINYVKLLILC